MLSHWSGTAPLICQPSTKSYTESATSSALVI
nr:MAG TPA: hypothetical protein [Caudoviricetes sp.]DAL69273.1 MAG TPA: hypothetical protein [Caudoviricetes sp.]